MFHSLAPVLRGEGRGEGLALRVRFALQEITFPPLTAPP
jgi:hypothetical protein